MLGSNRRGVITLLATVALVAGCRMATASAPPASAPLVTTSTAPTGGSTAVASVTASVEPAPTPEPSKPSRVAADTIAVTVVDGLRVRSQPRVSGDSFMYDPLLPIGTPLYVLEGPVLASDYAWFNVVPLTARSLHSGWVAAGSRTNEPWFTPGTFDCPSMPTEVGELAGLRPGVGLACYPGAPITIRARLVDCNCDMDGPSFTPSWLGIGGGNPMLLVDPARTSPPRDVGEWMIVHLDPEGRHPAVLPVGQVVTVTGVFDHPAASSCTVTDFDVVDAPTKECRLVFAVTDLAVAR